MFSFWFLFSFILSRFLAHTAPPQICSLFSPHVLFLLLFFFSLLLTRQICLGVPVLGVSAAVAATAGDGDLSPLQSARSFRLCGRGLALPLHSRSGWRPSWWNTGMKENKSKKKKKKINASTTSNIEVLSESSQHLAASFFFFFFELCWLFGPQMRNAGKFATLRTRSAAMSDARVRTTNDMLSAVRLLKM
jgi:hypothetical protein